MSYRELYKPDEKPLAIMVPAWNETGVIGNMAELAATTLDYENYHIFVGTYPNDPDTQRDVDEVCARFPNVHKVVCARPGPTSKADCLNNVLDAITQFERSANFAFAGFILHDAEDVISPMELRLFNYLVERKDLIQIPVYPFEREWTHFTSMTYIDEFSELHGKDVPVREALAGQVPSAGVGTCFSRRAVTALLADGDGIAFDVQSLTEDYDIGFRLKEKGMTDVKRVGLYGLTYKENVDDMRESPTLQLLESQERHLATGLKVYDPFVAKDVVDNQYHDLDEFLSGVDMVVIMVKHNEIKDNVEKLKDKVVLDCHNIIDLLGVYHI